MEQLSPLVKIHCGPFSDGRNRAFAHRYHLAQQGDSDRREKGGTSLQDCEKVNRAARIIVPDDTDLVVQSAGIGWQMKASSGTLGQLAIFIGMPVKLFVKSGERMTEKSGVLASFGDFVEIRKKGWKGRKNRPGNDNKGQTILKTEV